MAASPPLGDQIDQYFQLEQAIHDAFGYVENWVVIPLDDARQYYWRREGETICFARSQKELVNQSGNYYEESIYRQRFLDQHVFTTSRYTLISCDTGVDGNKFLRIFNNKKKC